MHRIPSESITVKLLTVVISASVLSAVLILLIANKNLIRIIDQSQNSMYAEKLKVICNALDQADKRLRRTGWVEAYSEDFKKSAVKSIQDGYYFAPDQPIYPWILDHDGQVILHPVLPPGDRSLKSHEGMRWAAAQDHGAFNGDYNGRKKWYIYQRFEAWNWIVGFAVPLDMKYADANAFQTTLLMVMGGVTLLMIVIVSLIVARFTKPIITLTHHASQIANGNLDQPIDLGGKDEVGALARSFDNMRHSIQQQIRDLNHEIDERRRAEKQLQRNEENLRTTLDSIGDAVIATDTAGIIVRMNPVAEKLTGWPVDQAKGKPLSEVLHLVHARTREPIECPTQEIFAGSQNTELPDNSLLIARDGSEAHVADSGAPIRSHTGEVLGAVVIFRDVTMERALQERLRQSYKMDAIGQLAGGVAHDFNNMLAAISGAAQMLKRFLPEEEPKAARFHSIITDSTARAAELTNKLLTFARRQPSASAVIDLHQIINDTVALLESTIDRRIAVRTELAAKASRVSGDFSQLQNALLNLGINASQAMPKGGTILIHTANLELDEETCQAGSFELEPGTYLEIEVRDTGTGIAQNVLPHIFEPFFTTKAQGKGTGLGLASTFGTVQQHKGSITARNLPSGGACFRILLPLTGKAENAPTPPSADVIRGSGTILVVDDEESLRTTAEEILRDLGYTVLQAADGRQALDLFAKDPKAIDLVLLDMMMPQMNGRDCFAAMRKIDPDVRAILVSGFSPEEDLEQLQASGLRGFLSKPYRLAELSQRVHAALS